MYDAGDFDENSALMTHVTLLGNKMGITKGVDSRGSRRRILLGRVGKGVSRKEYSERRSGKSDVRTRIS